MFYVHHCSVFFQSLKTTTVEHMPRGLFEFVAHIQNSCLMLPTDLSSLLYYRKATVARTSVMWSIALLLSLFKFSIINNNNSQRFVGWVKSARFL